MKEQENDLGAVSATEGDAVPCSVPASTASHADVMRAIQSLIVASERADSELWATYGDKSPDRVTPIMLACAAARKEARAALRSLAEPSRSSDRFKRAWLHAELAFSARIDKDIAHYAGKLAKKAFRAAQDAFYDALLNQFGSGTQPSSAERAPSTGRSK